ncbi:hypothetical protein [Aminobacter carboxidus]|uniref:Integrase n=1 Tax=Aminobacter carboxidus TaxID=376165 RepID=A0ABR9GJ75_9HYPH|nr:hypothetical protein [Aminobacter carboxidus]MBE1203685.1 hypothetical protein [Aminobacter carboxidus]
MKQRRSNNIAGDVALQFWVEAHDGSYYPVDLTEFAEGRKREDVPPQLQARWPADFQGRLGFALGLSEVFQALCPPESYEADFRSSCRQLLRFLDSIDPDQSVKCFADLKDGHGIALAKWAEAKGFTGSVYKHIKGLVDAARMTSGSTPLFWPARERDPIVHKDDVDLKAYPRLYNAFKKEAMSIKAMFQEGERLANGGRDPRGLRSTRASAAWEQRENHAWLVRKLTRNTLPSKEDFYAAGARGLNKANNVRTQKHNGPEYLAPGMTERASEGIVGKLRWFHPSYQDTAVFFWLFLVGTGWNLSTAIGIDISDEKHWWEPHPQKPEFCVLHSFKGRADKHVFIPCLRKPEWHPYRIIEFMIKCTAPLRRTVLQRLADARAKYLSDGMPETAAEIVRLETMSRSPWLFHVVNKVGEVGCLHGDDSSHLNEIARLAAQKHGLFEDHPALAALVTGDARDAWIGHAYITSGNNILIARLAGQHEDYRSLVHYLRRRRYRAQSEGLVRAFQDVTFGEIESGRVLDATRIRLKLERGEITLEQERRLLDRRQRTRLGMGCLQPDSPPKNVSPDHVPGAICRVQRCTGCINGIVFEESLDPLTRARAELIYIQRTIPLAAWTGSSFEEEAASLDATLMDFAKESVGESTQLWLNKLLSGELQVHDTFPAY